MIGAGAVAMAGRQDKEYLEKLAIAEKRGDSRAAPQPSNAKASTPKPPPELDPLYRSRSVDDIADRRSRIEGVSDSDRKLSSTRRALRKAERQSGDGSDLGGTGHTILKLRQPPIAMLIDKGKIAGEEIQAADEIALAFFAIDVRGRLRGATMDRVDGGGGSGSAPWPAITAKAVGNYQRWANYWSDRNTRYGDPLLEAVIAAVIDERPIRTIALDVGRRHSKVEDAVVFGLRDYAARAGMVSGGMAKQWMAQAEELFVPARTVLLDAVRRARVER